MRAGPSGWMHRDCNVRASPRTARHRPAGRRRCNRPRAHARVASGRRAQRLDQGYRGEEEAEGHQDLFRLELAMAITGDQEGNHAPAARWGCLQEIRRRVPELDDLVARGVQQHELACAGSSDVRPELRGAQDGGAVCWSFDDGRRGELRRRVQLAHDLDVWGRSRPGGRSMNSRHSVPSYRGHVSMAPGWTWIRC